MKKRKVKRKALSPVVSTTILISVVVIIAVIIIMFSRSFIKEAILKEIAGTEKRVEDFCREVVLKPILNEDGSFGVSNSGNVPVGRLVIKTSKYGNSETVQINSPVNPGGSVMINGYLASDYEEIEVIPVLIGKSKSGASEPYTCPDNYGVEI